MHVLYTAAFERGVPTTDARRKLYQVPRGSLCVHVPSPFEQLSMSATWPGACCRRSVGLLLTAILLAGLLSACTGPRGDEAIRVGVLHSLSGTMAFSERDVVDATLLAIEQINERGGVLGRRVEPVIRDGASDWDLFASLAQELIVDESVAVVFGCWTSASRKTVLPVFERYDHLLFYPVQYEGLESSPNIVYTGAAPNQQIIPAVKWAMDNLGQRFFLVGSDYVFPRAANRIMSDQILSLRGQVLGESYVLLGSTDVDAAVAAIVDTRPDVILNTLNGDSNIAFFERLRAEGITPNLIPTISFSIAEVELQAMGSAAFVGDFAAWNYFQSVDTEENQAFVDAFQGRFGADRVLTDPMEAAFNGVHLWAAAAELAGSTATAAVRTALASLSLAAPHGPISVDPTSQHLWKSVRIGRIRSDGQFDIVWETPKPVRPLPFPPYRSLQEWQLFLDDMQGGWGGQWANPGPAGAES